MTDAKYIKKIKIRLMEAQFNARKWRTNSAELRELMADDDVCKDTKAKNLGIGWNNEADTLHIDAKEIFEGDEKVRPTKRNVLKVRQGCGDQEGSKHN